MIQMYSCVGYVSPPGPVIIDKKLMSMYIPAL